MRSNISRALASLSLLAALGPLSARAAPRAPYSLPWQLRPTAAVSVVRSDTSLALSSADATGDSVTTATLLLVSYKVTPSLAPLVRVGYVDHAPGTGSPGAALVNPVLGAIYSHDLSETLRLGFFLGFTLPVGMGGGNTPRAATAAAARSGVLTRSAMDNAMFAVNDFTVFPGVGLSYVAGGFTAQVEATVLQLTRVRGEAVQQDKARTNFTSGLHLGYFVHPAVSLGGELRYQRWLSTPSTVTSEELRDNLTVAAGPRLHFKLSDSLVLRPGLSYAFALDAPMKTASYSVFQLDVPLVF
ncbi:hypothetical protein [Myxococcus sp. RHSTA-1-4]|uniref:hypothetical protein n=1 Tax=Myxococcus sp. RHSTA-1-4 TaxID=2874601 RepID=UPI001CC18427|nr:hypothetical protein [Myxococcus sp. RHSTA-1-4]MBZ4416525.1 hypothetical protein [Myxococcus sp. RHSTA-1-4]